MTYDLQIQKKLDRLIKNEMVDPTTISTSYRQKFFNKYTIRIVLSIYVQDLFKFDELVANVSVHFNNIALLVAKKETSEILIYSSDPKVLSIVNSKCKNFWVNQIMFIDKSSWNKKFPKPKQKNPLYFGKYQYRIGFNDPKWETKEDRIFELSQLGIDYKIVTRIFPKSKTPLNPAGWPKECFVYVDKLPEVLVMKLMYGNEISEISTR